MTTSAENEAFPTFDTYLSILRRQRWLIVAVTVVGLVLGLARSALTHPAYTSHATVLPRPVVAQVFDASGAPDKILNMYTERELVRSRSVAIEVKRRTKSPRQPGGLQRRVNVDVVGSTQLLAVSFTENSRQKAQAGAQAFAESYLDLKRQQATTDRDQRRAALLSALAPLDDGIATATAGLSRAPVGSPAASAAKAAVNDLSKKADPYRQQLVALSALHVEDTGQVVSPARLPRKSSQPAAKSSAAAGALLGLLLGLGIACVKDKGDRRLRGRHDLESGLGAPVLAAVPRTRSLRRHALPGLAMLTEPDGPASEGYRMLRARLLSMAERNGVKTVLVTSPRVSGVPVAANLAVCLAQAGKRVVLVSADLRSSDLGRYFALESDHGLTDVLTGAIPSVQALQRPVGVDGLQVCVSGPDRPDGGVLLQLALMREFLLEHRGAADIVVIEAPSALDTSECQALALLVDGVVVVADARHTSRWELAEVKEQLDQAGTPVLGSVLHGTAR